MFKAPEALEQLSRVLNPTILPRRFEDPYANGASSSSQGAEGDVYDPNRPSEMNLEEIFREIQAQEAQSAAQPSESVERLGDRYISHFVPGNIAGFATREGITPEDFDASVAQYPGYSIEHGGRCGCTALQNAVQMGNLPLVAHIIELGRERFGRNGEFNLAQLGNQFGHTPLWTCATISDYAIAVEIAKLLLKSGARVNDASITGAGDSRWGEIDRGTTPLSMVLEKTHNVALASLLLRWGATIPENLSPKGKEMLDKAQEEIKKTYVRAKL